MSYIPILFNTEMVRAIQAGRKTQTRRIAKQLCGLYPRKDGLPPEKFDFFISPSSRNLYWKDLERQVTVDGKIVFAPFTSGDILWVRETWQYAYNYSDNDQAIEGTGRYVYFADDPMTFDYWVDVDTGEHKEQMPWRPSIHMPKEAARIFLRVKDVRVERLQEISASDAMDEGFEDWNEFVTLWNTTIKHADIDKYGWNADPWVWVIEFERCEKPVDWR